MKSGIGIWNKVRLSIAFVGLALCVPGSQLLGQDNFREFDRKMVATPAELYEALSNLQATTKQNQIDPQRLKEIEKAGRNFLSQLSPEQQDKAWDFAEKYLRKNGVDSASAQKLMQEFGLPPEMQNELSKQLQKFGGKRLDSDAEPNGAAGGRDEISRLLQKAREEFSRADLQDGGDGRGAKPSSRPYPAGESADPGDGPQRTRDSQSTRERSANRSSRETRQRNSTVQDPNGQATTERSNARANTSGGSGGGSTRGQGSDSGSTGRSEADSRSRPTMSRNRARGGRGAASDAATEKLMKQLQDARNAEDVRRKMAGGLGGEDGGDSGSSDTGWTKILEDLKKEDKDIAEKLARQINNNSSARLDQAFQNSRSSNDQANKSMLERAKGLFSGALDSKKESITNGLSGSQSGSRSNEKVGTRFDRLLVKAVDRTLDRTLESQNEQGVSDGVSGVLGKLIERFQDQDSTGQGDQTRESGRRDSRQATRGGRRRDSSSGSDAERNSGNEIGESNRSSANRNSANRGGSAPRPQLPQVDTPSFNPRSILDAIPDLKSVNPTHVFTFFAIVGVILLVGYMLTQSLTPDEVATKKRKVIKQVRNAKVSTPKDLVESVDMFLLAKFGIKSSWWNAALAQRVLDSGSPQLQGQVDDLFRDYVRARYMRSDVQIPVADQGRFKQTLEQLSKLDIKPEPGLGFVPEKAASTAVSLEG